MYAECACRYILVAVGKPPSHDCCFFFSSLLRSLCFLFSLAIRISEIVWEIASQLRLQPDTTFPIPNALSLPPGKQDSRRIMGTVYQLFKGLNGVTERDLAMAGLLDAKKSNPPPKPPSDDFYALFYLALYNEARGNDSKSLHYMRQALHTAYAKANNSGTGGGGDYMVAVARVSLCFFVFFCTRIPFSPRRSRRKKKSSFVCFNSWLFFVDIVYPRLRFFTSIIGSLPASRRTLKDNKSIMTMVDM
jgi:hypothetical protein